jgi:hypothetical protein
VVVLLSLKPGEAAAVTADLGGMLTEGLSKPRGDQVPARVQPFAADLGQRGLVQAIDGGAGQPRPLTGGFEGSEQPPESRTGQRSSAPPLGRVAGGAAPSFVAVLAGAD